MFAVLDKEKQGSAAVYLEMTGRKRGAITKFQQKNLME